MPSYIPLENELKSRFIKLHNYNKTLDTIWKKISDKIAANPLSDPQIIIKSFSILELRYLAGQIIKNC